MRVRIRIEEWRGFAGFVGKKRSRLPALLDDVDDACADVPVACSSPNSAPAHSLDLPASMLAG